MVDVGGDELMGDAGSLPFARSVATRGCLLDIKRSTEGYREREREALTSIQMRLLGYIVVRVAVRVDGPVELLERHESHYQLVVGVEEAA
jgi:hypothetical protein